MRFLLKIIEYCASLAEMGNKSAITEHMKSLTEHLWFEVPNRRGFVNHHEHG